MKATQIVLAERPVGVPTARNFLFEEISLPELADGEVCIKTLYISVDPYMRGRMSDRKSYTAPFEVNAPLNGGVVGVIEESKSEKFKVGDHVLGVLPWSTRCVAKEADIKKIDPALAPPSYYLGVLGMPGLTAYFGLVKISKPKAGETVVVSGAAGAVGLVVGQIAKALGCTVVGIAGSDEKTELLKKDFGFDAAINYKTTPNLFKALAAACPKGIDVYFDNVGGDISDAVIAHLNFHARIALCGQIALYNATEQQMGPRNFPILLTKSVMLQGFIVTNYQADFDEAIKQLAQWIKEGKIVYKETVLEGIDLVPKAFIGLFSGENTGKMLVKIND